MATLFIVLFGVCFIMLILNEYFNNYRNKKTYKLSKQIIDAEHFYNINKINNGEVDKVIRIFNKLPSYNRMCNSFWKKLTAEEWLSEEDYNLLKDYL